MFRSSFQPTPIQEMFRFSLHPTPLKNASFPSPIDVESHNPLPLGPASSLAHHSVSDSDTICRATIYSNSSSPLVDIVFFELSFPSFPSRFLQRVDRIEVSTRIRNVSFHPPTNEGSHKKIQMRESELIKFTLLLM